MAAELAKGRIGLARIGCDLDKVRVDLGKARLVLAKRRASWPSGFPVCPSAWSLSGK